MDRTRTRFDGSCFVEASQYLGDASMGDQELAADVAWSHANERQFDDTLAHMEWKWTSIHEESA